MDYFELFFSGHKPALYETILCPRFSEYLPRLLEQYPYINQGIGLIPETTTYMFFQNEDLKASFQHQLEKVTVNSPRFHQLLGLTLGYPPKAVEFYVKCITNPKLERHKIGYHYGVCCSGSVKDLEENCHWLWDTYGSVISTPLEIRIGPKFFPVQHDDIDRLKELKEAALIWIHKQEKATV